MELVARSLRADPRNSSVASDAISRLSTLRWTLSSAGLASDIRERCFAMAPDVLEVATRYPDNRALQNLAAATLDCNVDIIRLAPAEASAEAAAAPGTADAELGIGGRLKALLRPHAAYLEAAFLDGGRRVADQREFHYQMGNALQRLQRQAERDGNVGEAERLAGVLVAGLSARKAELDYDIFAMGRLSRAHRDLAGFAASRGDVEATARHLRICADPEQVPFPDRECMTRLADMIERGDLGTGQEGLAQELRARVPHYALRRFTVPVRLSPDAPTFPLEVYIPPPLGYEGIDHMVRWAREARGLEIPADVVTSFRRLHQIARENNVSFPELAAYALGNAPQRPAAPAPATADADLRRIADATRDGFVRSSQVSTDEAGVAIGGYDTVAFFREGRARQGSGEHFVVHGGAIWFFASAENAQAFRSEPERYLPQFGGHCAGCLAQGSKVHADPEHWVVVNDRLYLNSSASLRNNWQASHAASLPRARAEWERQRDLAIRPARETEAGRHIVALRRR